MDPNYVNFEAMLHLLSATLLRLQQQLSSDVGLGDISQVTSHDSPGLWG